MPRLVLTRDYNEVVYITTGAGERIEVMVLENSGDKVRLSFDAPLTVKINRKEVQEAIERDGERKRA